MPVWGAALYGEDVQDKLNWCGESCRLMIRLAALGSDCLLVGSVQYRHPLSRIPLFNLLLHRIPFTPHYRVLLTLEFLLDAPFSACYFWS